jgi:hypothetical protein
VKPLLLVDKSMFDSISRPAAHALFRHFSVAIPDILVREILGDRAKIKRPEQFSRLVTKFQNAAFEPLVEYWKLIRDDLFGDRVPMDGRPVVPGVLLDSSSGPVGVFDKSKRHKQIETWLSGIISESEESEARAWRQAPEQNDPDGFVKRCQDLPLPKAPRFIDALALTNHMENNMDQAEALRLLLDEYVLSEQDRQRVTERWIKLGRPPVKVFAPYAAYCAKVRGFYSVVLLNRLGGFRKTDIRDLEYLYYLPFCQIFCSGDRFHGNLAPLLMRRDQEFIGADRLPAFRRDLVAAQDFWLGLTQTQKEKWVTRFGYWPANHKHSLVNQCWARYGVPKAISGDAMRHLPPDIQRFVWDSAKQVVRDWRAKHNKGNQDLPEHITIPLPQPVNGLTHIIVDTRSVV